MNPSSHTSVAALPSAEPLHPALAVVALLHASGSEHSHRGLVNAHRHRESFVGGPECDMKGQDARLPGVLAQCRALVHLDVSRNFNFRAAGAKSLAGVLGQCTALAHLNLSGNYIRASGVESLAGVLGQCPVLAHLNLSNNQLGARWGRSYLCFLILLIYYRRRAIGGVHNGSRLKLI